MRSCGQTSAQKYCSGLCGRAGLQIKVRTALLCAVPVLLILSITLQGPFPAVMILCAVIVMEPGPVHWAIAALRSRAHLARAEPA